MEFIINEVPIHLQDGAFNIYGIKPAHYTRWEMNGVKGIVIGQAVQKNGKMDYIFKFSFYIDRKGKWVSSKWCSDFISQIPIDILNELMNL